MSRSLSTFGLIAIRGVLALVLSVSGVGKLIDPTDAGSLVEIVMGSQSILTDVALPLVIAVSLAELALAIWLVWGRGLSGALWACLGMVGGFTVVIGSLVVGGQSVSTCGCFGAFELGLSAEATFLRNLGLLAVILTGLLLSDGGAPPEADRAGAQRSASPTSASQTSASQTSASQTSASQTPATSDTSTKGDVHA